MKKFFIGLISCVIILSSSLVYADILGGGDDRYIGFQVAIPFKANGAGLFSGKAEYSALLIDQRNGYKEGISFTQDIYRNQTMGYLRPSRTFEIGHSRISDHSIPLLTRDQEGVTQFGLVTGVAAIVVVGALVTILVVDTTAAIVDCIVEAEVGNATC